MKSLWSKILCGVLVLSMVVGAIYFIPTSTDTRVDTQVNGKTEKEVSVEAEKLASNNTATEKIEAVIPVGSNKTADKENEYVADEKTATEDQSAVEEKTVAEDDCEDNCNHDEQEETIPVSSYVTKTEKKSAEPTGEYNKGVVLVKTEEFSESLLGDLEYVSVEPLFVGSKWYEIKLSEGANTEEAVAYLMGQDVFDDVDYDYLMQADAEVESIDISANTLSGNQTQYLETMGVGHAWAYGKNKHKDDPDYNPGGSEDVIVAVIDTGVDYNHVDLRNNIWVNTDEIPNNGIDDDHNGYIDDYYGWDCVWEDNDPMDDNGHGTHVAGIVAAENNEAGTVGVSYNCKIMCIKAGNASGYFNSSDIAQAIQYAYINGASVINMSFGGSTISVATEEALKDAYNSCVLVAAAGNDGLCNQPGCIAHLPVPFYPAALPYVIGVMSCDVSGNHMSSFTNFDHYYYNNYEYEVFACGESIVSTFPGNKYATLSGTSMATPMVSGIAALLRSEYSDLNTYSTKFIQLQIVNTGKKSPDGIHTVVDAKLALEEAPTPNAYIHNIVIYDDPSINSNNNGDGVIDAGETVHIGLKVLNIGGVASNVKIKASLPEMETAATILGNTEISFPSVGTYSIQNGGYIYSGDEIIDETYCFVLDIADNAPNDYNMTITFELSYDNGLDDSDKTRYVHNKQYSSVTIQHGESLPVDVSTDVTLSGDKVYFLDHNVTVYKGATLTIEAGAQIETHTNNYSQSYAPTIKNYGTLIINGSAQKQVNISPSSKYKDCFSFIENYGTLVVRYCDMKYVAIDNNNGSVELNHCSIYSKNYSSFYYVDGGSRCWHSGRYIIDISQESTAQINDSRIYGANIYIRNSYGKDVKVFNNLFFECFFDSFRYSQFYNNFLLGSRSRNFGARTFENNVISKSSKEEIIDFTTEKSGPDYSKYYQNILLGSYKNYKLNGLISNYISSSGDLLFDLEADNENFDYDVIWPYVTDIKIKDKDGTEVHTIGKEQVTFEVYFNRAMDTSKPFYLYFGTRTPYSDYKISGQWDESGKKWVGTYTLTADIENGIQYFKFGDACAADDAFKELVEYTFDFTFTIDTTSALSMSIQPVATDTSIDLTWVQDDYNTLMGYNVYRSNDRDGNFVKLNTAIIPAGEHTFSDTNAEPGKTYWYTFTVVLTDFSESNPAGKVSCTAKDTIAPNIYHTPVNQGYLGNNLTIICTASDNIGITYAILYYRTTETLEWTSISMSKANDSYSGTIFGSLLSLEGLEYYIEASDGTNTITKGTAESPYSVIIKEASALAGLGDVDGDGAITIMDALMILQAINNKRILTDDEFARADLNDDDKLSAMEALRILQYVNGKVTSVDMKSIQL